MTASLKLVRFFGVYGYILNISQITLVSFAFFYEIFVRKKKSNLGQSIDNHLWCWAWRLTLTSKHENCFSEQFLFSYYESSTFIYIKKIQCICNCVVLINQIKICLKFCKLFSICLPCQSAKHAPCLGLPFQCIFARISMLEFSWWNVWY